MSNVPVTANAISATLPPLNQWLASDSVKAAIVGGSIALIGIVITFISVFIASRNSRRQLREQLTHAADQTQLQIANSTEQLRMQLEHAAESARLGREFEMRRQVYMDAAEAVSRIGQAFSLIPNLAISDADLNKLETDAASKIARVHIVGNLETVRAAAKLMQSATVLKLPLYAGRSSLQRQAARLQQLDEWAAAHTRDQRKWYDEYQLAKYRNAEEPELARIRVPYKDAEKFEAKIRQDRDELSKQHGLAIIRLLRDSLQRNAEWQKDVPPALTLVRNELGLETDEESYAGLVRGGAVQALQAVDDLIKAAGIPAEAQQAQPMGEKPAT
jgi:hypothetical protein